MESLKASLRDAGLRATPQRLAVLGVLQEQGHDQDPHRHLSAQEIFELAAERVPGLNQATVYRTLEGLATVGLVDRMHSGPLQRFAIHNDPHRHGHLYCQGCQRNIVLDMTTVSSLAQLIEKEHDFSLDQRHLTLSGRCSECSN